MTQNSQIFRTIQRSQRLFTWGDLFAIILIVVLLYFGVQLARNAPQAVSGPDISLSVTMLPFYTVFSLGRMAAAYALSILFTLLYGRAAAYHRRAELVLMPLLDVLQSVPILSFLPVVLLSLSAILPEKIAAELASIVLIFTSQAWNLTFSWYQSLTTIPKDLEEASMIFRLNAWIKFKKLELPFGMISLIWNSMMSWAGGWFFLMAAEIFTVGARDFRLPGLGAYLQEAANQSDYRAIAWGIGTLILTIVLLDQFVWRPLLAWSDRFKLEMIENDNPPRSWFYDLIHRSVWLKLMSQYLIKPLSERLDRRMLRFNEVYTQGSTTRKSQKLLFIVLSGLFILIILYFLTRAAQMLFSVPLDQWMQVGAGISVTLLRVVVALAIALLWTIPLGVAIGTNPRLAAVFQPIVQVAASVPATALFPVILLFVMNMPGGLNLAAIILMLMGTQWYLLFNIIAGAAAIPQDLKYTARLMQLDRWQRWTTLIMPGIFPYLITGAITASGGAWNASIVAEHQTFAGKQLSVTGIGAIIASATAQGNYPLLLGATLTMILTVILLNRLVWRRLYALAEEKFRMEM